MSLPTEGSQLPAFKNATIEALLRTDPRIRLCDEMIVLRDNLKGLEELIARKKWIEVAGALSNIQWASRNAEWAVNDIIRPVKAT